MKDEIKEILFQLEIVARKHTVELCEDGSKIETMSASVVDELRLNNYSSKLLLDYITNLQEENKRLKELCDKYEVEHNTAFKLWTMKTEEIPTYEEKKELQNRIDKVLKSLIRKQNGFGVITSVIDEINILQGKSDE